METNETMDVYLRRHDLAYRGFLAAGQNPLSESFLAQHILLSLPEEYDYVRSIVNTMTSDDLTTRRVKDILFAEWQQRVTNYPTDRETTHGVYFTKKPANKSRTDSSNVRCFRCKKVGHRIKDCRMPESKDAKNSNSDVSQKLYAATTCLGVRHKQDVIGKSSNCWIVDTAATAHISNDRDDFTEFVEISEEVTWGSTAVCKVLGKGNIVVSCNPGNGIKKFRLESVLYIPEFRYKVFSVGTATDHDGWSFSTRDRKMTARHDNNLVFFAVKNTDKFFVTKLNALNDHYSKSHMRNSVVDIKNEPHGKTNSEREKPISCAVSEKVYDHGKSVNKIDNIDLWHKRLGHVNKQKIKDMKAKGIVHGLERESIKDVSGSCESCLEMKSVRLKFNKHDRLRANGKLELIHSDICGPMRVASKGGALYVLTFMDDFSRKSDVFLLKRKSEVFETFLDYKAKVEKESGCCIKVIRTDNGGEFCNQKMDDYLRKAGIKHELTTAYTPQQNGGAERLNRTLVEKVRCLLRESGLPECFWGEAMLTANFLRNRVPTNLCGDIVPIELWTGKKPSIRFLRVYGCRVYARIPKPRWRGKFGPRATKGILMGYGEDHKACRIWSEEEQSIIYSRDVRFLENVQGWEQSKEQVSRSDIDRDDYVIMLFPDESQEERTGMTMLPLANVNSTELPDLPNQNDTSACEMVSEAPRLLNQIEEQDQSQESHVEPSTPGDTESSVEEEHHWENGRNLRERTEKVKPAKYTCTTGVVRNPVSIEELTREYGWNPDGDYW
jgi:hypothetical protein